MKRVRQLSVFLKNEPGALQNLTHILRDEGFSILGITVSDSVDHAVVRLVLDDPARAVHFLGDNGVLVVDNDILAVSLPNQPGALAVLGGRLAEAGVNIEYAYGSLRSDEQKGFLFVRVSDVDRAEAALRSDLPLS